MKGRASKDDDNDSVDLPLDEISEIKRAMREANARKKMMAARMQDQTSKRAFVRDEASALLRSNMDDLELARKNLSNAEFALREAKFEISQLHNQIDKLKEEQRLSNIQHRAAFGEISTSLESHVKSQNVCYDNIANELDKVGSLVSNLAKNANENGLSLNSRTSRQMLESACLAVDGLRHYLASIRRDHQNNALVPVTQNNSVSLLDTSLMDMCRNLEEENINLQNILTETKSKLTDAQRDSTANKLIPHYRLAIVRARTFASNLSEQITKEKELNTSLKEQLDTTYNDLKQVVNENLRLKEKIERHAKRAKEKKKYYDTLKQQNDALVMLSQKNNISNENENRINQQPIRNSNRRLSNNNNGNDTTTTLGDNQKDIERHLKQELNVLDDEIDLLKEKLEKAALAKSQQILHDIFEHPQQQHRNNHTSNGSNNRLASRYHRQSHSPQRRNNSSTSRNSDNDEEDD